GGLVRIGGQSLCAGMTCEIICLTPMTDAQLADLQSRLAQFESVKLLEYAMLGERASAAETAALTYSGSAAGSGQIRGTPGRWVPILAPVDQEATLRLMTRYCAAARLDPPSAIREARAIEVELKQTPKYCLVTNILVTSLLRIFELNY